MKAINYILGSIYRVFFFISLLIFHPIQLIAFNVFGSAAQLKAVTALNGVLTWGLILFGNRLSFHNPHELPLNRPLILAANHQSMWDIVGIYWYMRKYKPVFVSKVELKTGIPSISYNLRKSGAAFVDLKDKKGTIAGLLRLSQKIRDEKRAAVIFPEGIRSRDGVLKEFAAGGLGVLMKKCPEALIVPIAINGTGAITGRKYKINVFKKVSWVVKAPINPEGKTPIEIANLTQFAIAQELGQA